MKLNSSSTILIKQLCFKTFKYKEHHIKHFQETTSNTTMTQFLFVFDVVNNAHPVLCCIHSLITISPKCIIKLAFDQRISLYITQTCNAQTLNLSRVSSFVLYAITGRGRTKGTYTVKERHRHGSHFFRHAPRTVVCKTGHLSIFYVF